MTPSIPICVPFYPGHALNGAGRREGLGCFAGPLDEIELEPRSRAFHRAIAERVSALIAADVCCFVDHGVSPLQLIGAGSQRDPLRCLASTAASLQDWLTAVTEKGEGNFS